MSKEDTRSLDLAQIGFVTPVMGKRMDNGMEAHGLCKLGSPLG